MTSTMPLSSTTVTTMTVSAGLEAMQTLASTLAAYDERMVELAAEINATVPNVPQSVSDELESMVEVTMSGLRNLLDNVPVHLEYGDAWQYLCEAADAMWVRGQATLNGVEAVRESGIFNAGYSFFAQGRYQRDRYRETFAHYQAALPGAPTTVTTLTDIHPLSDLDWPKEGLQPEAVVEAIREQQGSNRGP